MLLCRTIAPAMRQGRCLPRLRPMPLHRGGDVQVAGRALPACWFSSAQLRAASRSRALATAPSEVADNHPLAGDQWKTLPNALTGLRLVAVPGLVCVWYAGFPGTAAVLFGVAAATDFLDGYLARLWKQQTALGALLDPLADKLLVAAALCVLVEHHAHFAVTVPALIILSRELLVSSLREWMQKHRPGVAGQVAVAWHGKAKTALQLIALQLLLAAAATQPRSATDAAEKQEDEKKEEGGRGEACESSSGSSSNSLLHLGGVGCLWAAALLTAGSGATYVRVALRR